MVAVYPKGVEFVEPGIRQVVIKALKSNLMSKLKNRRFVNIVALVLAFTLILTGIIVFSDRKGEDIITESSAESETVVFAAESSSLIEAYGLYIDGSFIAATEEAAYIENALVTLTEGKVASLAIADVTGSQLLNETEIVCGGYEPEKIVSAAQLYSLLGMEDEYSFTFSISSISGEPLDISISVLVYATGIEEIELAYDTTYVDTDAQRAGYEKKVLSGKAGAGIISYELVYINDELIQTNYICTDVVSEPESEVIERGVLSADRTVNSLGILEMPYNGRISSYFGWRSLGYHEGIDLIAFSGSCYGHDVYASAAGVVIYSGWTDGYGKNVHIDHGDGLVTVYAHLSAMSVNEGDFVLTGDTVGQIGTTGRVTGPHLHFEVQHNGVKKDPLLFLKMN